MFRHLQRLMQLVKSAGLPVTMDARDANPPCVWLGATQATRFTLTGDITGITAELVLIAPNVGGHADLIALDRMCDRLLPVLMVGNVDVHEIEYDASATLPGGGGAMPAYRITIEI